MAIDTAEKRKSLSAILVLSPGVTPNAGKDQEWRQEAACIYSGIATAAVFAWSWDLEAYISSSWVSIKRDVEVFRAPTVAKRGINGAGITNRVAAPGTLSCSLDNGESNSAGLLGYYSPEHTNMRANFGRDTAVRLSITYAGTTKYIWRGTVMDLEPSIGQFKQRSSKLFAVDYMQKLAEQKLNLLAVQEDQRSDQIVDTVVSSLTVQPLNTDYETDKFTLPFMLSAEMDEKTTAMGAIQKVCQTVLAYCYLIGNTTDGETLVFQREETRATQSSIASLDDTMSDMSPPRRPTEKLFNKIIGKIHPTRVDDDNTTLLYQNDSEIYVDGGNTETFTFRYIDPSNQSTRISALDIVTPLVAGTHYRGSKTQNSNLGDANAYLDITDTNGGNSSDWVVENIAGYRIYINLINIFGQGLYYYNPITITRETGSGDRETTYDFYYLDNSIRAKSFLTRLLQRTSSEKPEIDSVSFYADANETLMGYAMNVDVGSRVSLSETASGLDGDYTVNNIAYSFETNGTLKVSLGLEPADTVSYFILDSSVLDGPDVLSPF